MKESMQMVGLVAAPETLVASPYFFTPRQFNLLMSLYFTVGAVILASEFSFLLALAFLSPFVTKSECKPTRKAVLTLASFAILVLLVVVAILLGPWLNPLRRSFDHH